MPKLMLDRATLATLLQGNVRAIAAFERVLGDVGGALPSNIEEANALAGSALAVAQANAALLAILIDAVDRLDATPPLVPQLDPDDTTPAHALCSEQDDTTPRAHLGTISAQDADAVDIAGGTAALSTLSVSDQITSTVATGKPPFVVASTDQVQNLYAERAAHADSADLGVPTSYPDDATDLPTVITLANALKAAAISKGL